MDLSHAFKILEIDKTASFSELKQSYRDLASVWHPDRYSHNSRLSEKSLEKMKQLNAAYDLLSTYYSERASDKAGSNHYEYPKDTVVKCKECGTLNRIQNLTEVIFRCANCQSDLFSEKKYNDNTERILCADGGCIGIIRNGCCNVCGKTLEEGRQEEERKTKIYQENFRKKEKTVKIQKRNKAIKFSLIAAASVIFFAYVIYQDISSTGKKQTAESPQPVDVDKIIWDNNHPKYIFEIDKTNFDNGYYKTDDFKKLQKNLRIIGYEIVAIDGIIGPNTIKECNNFCTDFSFFSKVNSIANLLSTAKVHAEVSAIYPNWREIVRNNSLNKWLLIKPNEYKKEIRRALQSNNSKNILVVLNFYNFEKESPPQLPIPKNGIYWKSFGKGAARLTLSTREREKNHFIKILANRTNKEILKAFLRGGHTLELDIPLGSYIIKYAVGENWYGERFLFGPYTVYSKADKVFEFKRIGNQVTWYTVELYLQPHGNLHSSKLSAFQF